MNIILEAKRPNSPEWATRNRLDELNYEQRAGTTSAEMVLTKMINVKQRWERVEPATEFRLRNIE